MKNKIIIAFSYLTDCIALYHLRSWSYWKEIHENLYSKIKRIGDLDI